MKCCIWQGDGRCYCNGRPGRLSDLRVVLFFPFRPPENLILLEIEWEHAS